MSDSPRATGTERQKSIYLGGSGRKRPLISTRATLLEEQARGRMSAEAFAYIAGGAGEERTMAANRSAFDNWRIVPHYLRDVESRDTSTELFGDRLAAPFLLAPIGVLEMAHAQADRAVARAAAAEGVPFIFSNQASVPMEETAACMGDSPRWFQLYWSKSNDVVASFVERAERCGCSAIAVTLDTTMLGWRPRDLDLAFLPFLRGQGIAQYTSDPVFMQQVSERPDSGRPPEAPLNHHAIGTAIAQARNVPGPTFSNLKSGKARRAVQHFIETYSRPSLTWDELAFLREHTKLPILLKGILDADNAQRAVDHGIDGIVVSNHGGRQVDGAVATLDALPDIVRAVDGRMKILVDSGIRSGADAFKAIALGADAVCIGRPYAYALAVGGEAGVRECLQNFKADFDLTMGLSGCCSVSEIREGSTLVESSASS
ncbi:lactate 2-monooxygenase [Wenzhouxiangella sediminis]|uniref:Lactate 2-monooxygenase n=1 Tax=Wenzhouxiangella sediminis TaxID=1792836 RepID=A0A3E1K7K3_9GAMM|nr:lactate 2-monooxygenase [Wenzhouxiangella sediminis]RFF29988.1 lactate 2-monooxygenase [Wenzhouxiangella sediminis]